MAMAGVLVLGMSIMPRTTLAFSAAGCPAAQVVSPGASAPTAGDCSEGEAAEVRLEEELEAHEDEEEERAIAAERAAREVADAAEEAAEESREAGEREAATLHAADSQAALRLRVSVTARRGRSLEDLGETRLSATTSAPAQVRIVLLARGRPVKVVKGQHAGGRAYSLRVRWRCHESARRYTFTVSARAESDGRVGAGATIVRRGGFTVHTASICSRD